MGFFTIFFSALRAISLKEGNKIDIEIFRCFVFVLPYSIAMLLSGVKNLNKSLMVHDCNYDLLLLATRQS